MDVERVLKRYPRTAELRDGEIVTLRPLVAADEDQLIRLFSNIPYEELRNLRDNVADPAVVRAWCRHINYARVLPIVAEVNGTIVADATLHIRRVGPWRDVGRIRGYVHGVYRNKGLGTVLLYDLMDVAGTLGLHRVVVELYEDQHGLIRLLERHGFREEGRLPAYQTVVLARELPRHSA